MTLPKMLDGLPAGVVVSLRIDIHANGALSVHGPIDDPAWCLAALENAKDAVRNHKGPRALVVPGKDVVLT